MRRRASCCWKPRRAPQMPCRAEVTQLQRLNLLRVRSCRDAVQTTYMKTSMPFKQGSSIVAKMLVLTVGHRDATWSARIVCCSAELVIASPGSPSSPVSSARSSSASDSDEDQDNNSEALVVRGDDSPAEELNSPQQRLKVHAEC